MLTSSTSQGRRLPRVFRVFGRRSSVSSASGAGGMSGASGTAYFATCITFFIDENHVARLAPKPLPVHTVRQHSHPSDSGICSHAIVSLSVISGNQLSQLACHRVRCPFIWHSHVPTGRSHLLFPESAPTWFVLVVVFVCQHNHPLFFGNTLPHIMVSHILGSASFRTLCLFINTATAHHCIICHKCQFSLSH